jgi:hypothetical protein
MSLPKFTYPSVNGPVTGDRAGYANFSFGSIADIAHRLLLASYRGLQHLICGANRPTTVCWACTSVCAKFELSSGLAFAAHINAVARTATTTATPALPLGLRSCITKARIASQPSTDELVERLTVFGATPGAQ